MNECLQRTVDVVQVIIGLKNDTQLLQIRHKPSVKDVNCVQVLVPCTCLRFNFGVPLQFS